MQNLHIVRVTIWSFCLPSSPTCCSSPRKCAPVKCKVRQPHLPWVPKLGHLDFGILEYEIHKENISKNCFHFPVVGMEISS